MWAYQLWWAYLDPAELADGAHLFTFHMAKARFESPSLSDCLQRFMPVIVFWYVVHVVNICMHCTWCVQPFRSFLSEVFLVSHVFYSTTFPFQRCRKSEPLGSSLKSQRQGRCEWLLPQSIPVTGEKPRLSFAKTHSIMSDPPPSLLLNRIQHAA